MVKWNSNWGAIDAATKVRYIPTRFRDKNINAWITIPVKFKLNTDSTW